MLVVAVVIGVVAYVVSNLVGQVLNSLDDEDFQLEAQMLAGDLKEYTKYLLAYEKVTFLDSPVRRPAQRRDDLLGLWKQTATQPNLWEQYNFMNVCGSYDMGMKLVGTLEIDQDRVFCPSVIRRSDLTTKDLEDAFFKVWTRANGKAVVWRNGAHAERAMADVFITRDGDGNLLPDGLYRLTYDFSRKPKSTAQDPAWFVHTDNSIPLFVGQRLLEFARDPETGFSVEAKVYVDMFTDSMGFVGKLSERFYKIRSEVIIKRGTNTKKFVEVENFVLRTPTLKDFALFMAYPSGPTGAPTKNFSEAFRLPATSNIRGRVFFNGDIDNTTLDSLPNFHDTVFIGGSLLTKVGPADTQKFRSKFRRGLVTNLSAARFIFDGDCLPDQPSADPLRQVILNGTGIYCRTPAGVRSIEAFSSFNSQSPCRCFPRRYVKSADGMVSWQYDDQKEPGVPCLATLTKEQCNETIKNSPFFKSGGEMFMEVRGPEFLLGAVRHMLVTSESYVYGTVVAGHIAGSKNADFYSLTEMSAGNVGVGSASTLSAISAAANSTTFGVESPLTNIPLIQYAKDSFK